MASHRNNIQAGKSVITCPYLRQRPAHRNGAGTAYITAESPWENGFIESFNARLRDELLDGEIFYSLAEAKIDIEMLASPLQHYATQSSFAARAGFEGVNAITF